MAASNYMTELDYEAIWSTTIATAQFALIGVRMAEILNFRVNKDSTQQVTTAGSIPILEQISEECSILLIAASKTTAVDRPWDFIQANVMAFMVKQMRIWDTFLDDIAAIEGKKHDVKFSNLLKLPSHKDDRSAV